MELRARNIGKKSQEKRRRPSAPPSAAPVTAVKEEAKGRAALLHYGTIRYVALRYAAKHDSLFAYGPGLHLYLAGGFHPGGPASL